MAGHALVFRIMRLSPPQLDFHPSAPRFDLSEDMFADEITAPSSSSDPTAFARHPFARRAQLDEPSSLGVGQQLVLPQSFGVVHLGSTWAAFVTVCNATDPAVPMVSCKVGDHVGVARGGG